MLAEDWTNCPSCKFPALFSQFTNYVTAEKSACAPVAAVTARVRWVGTGVCFVSLRAQVVCVRVCDPRFPIPPPLCCRLPHVRQGD
jgi:hypothetical protein